MRRSRWWASWYSPDIPRNSTSDGSLPAVVCKVHYLAGPPILRRLGPCSTVSDLRMPTNFGTPKAFSLLRESWKVKSMKYTPQQHARLLRRGKLFTVSKLGYASLCSFRFSSDVLSSKWERSEILKQPCNEFTEAYLPNTNVNLHLRICVHFVLELANASLTINFVCSTR